MKAAALALLVLAASCSGGTVVQPAPIPDDYTSWLRIDATGEVPGHGDTYRIIYANDQAQLRGVAIVTPLPDAGTDTPDAGPDDPDAGPKVRITADHEYPEGSIIVKEVHERNGDQPGDLKYIAVMRKLLDAPSGAELKYPGNYSSAGWLFTSMSDIRSDEEYKSSCWDECHVAAPMDGAFYDYGQ
jgi:hypothetical protein